MSTADDSGTGPTVPAEQDAPASAPAPAAAAAPTPHDGDGRRPKNEVKPADHGNDGATQHLLPDEDEYQTVEDLLWESFKLTTLAVTPRCELIVTKL